MAAGISQGLATSAAAAMSRAPRAIACGQATAENAPHRTSPSGLSLPAMRGRHARLRINTGFQAAALVPAPGGVPVRPGNAAADTARPSRGSVRVVPAVAGAVPSAGRRPAGAAREPRAGNPDRSARSPRRAGEQAGADGARLARRLRRTRQPDRARLRPAPGAPRRAGREPLHHQHSRTRIPVRRPGSRGASPEARRLRSSGPSAGPGLTQLPSPA